MRIFYLDKPTSILLAKLEIEKELKEANKIENEMELQEFINFLNLPRTIFIKDDLVVPFRVYNDMLFIVAEEKTAEMVKAVIESFNSDFNSLIKVPTKDVYTGALENEEYYFIIDSDYMIINRKTKGAKK